MSHRTRRVVLGLGNILTGDEGLGLHAVAQLAREYGSAAGIEFLDGGMVNADMHGILEESSRLLVIEAVDVNRPPGTIVELCKGEVELYGSIRLSERQAVFHRILERAKRRGLLPPHLCIIGMQPSGFSLGFGLSREVADALPQLIERARDVLGEWGTSPPAILEHALNT